ncbi:rho gtpase activation protein [Anaeramoeba flamelloides]|uniref:Rho gtpase activation protein n=1 Tax=Anaeramoeba flamelloides TaxID=1746091 RepID=A0AAV7ZN80_9EUKA|nr:rho gtpase activation protein [Anaeramoeba flamelloides]
MKEQAQKESYAKEVIPHIIPFLTNQIKLEGGFNTEGIFRVPGNLNQILKYKEQINSWNFTPTKEVGNTAFLYASTLKLWLRELEGPILPLSNVPTLLKTEIESEMISIAENLPLINK